MSPRRVLIVAHDLFMTAAAIVASFYIRFQAAGLAERQDTLLLFLPGFVAYACAVYFLFHLYEAKRRFASLPDLINIVFAATALAVSLVAVDYALVATNVLGQFLFGKITILVYWILQIVFLSGPRIAYRCFRYSPTRQHTRSADAIPTLRPYPSYTVEQDERVISALGAEGIEFGRRLERAGRIDTDKFYKEFDAIIERTSEEKQKEYGNVHRRRFLELFNLSAELTAGIERPLVIEFGVSPYTRLYKKLMPGVRFHCADFVKPGSCVSTADFIVDESYGIDESYGVDLTRRVSREASLIPKGSYDLVLFAEVIEHLPCNPIEVLEWLLSLLKPGGYLLLTTPNMFSNMPAFMFYDNPLPPFPREEEKASHSAHWREYSHIELLRYVQAAGGKPEALIFSSCWDRNTELSPAERKNLVLISSRR